MAKGRSSIFWKLSIVVALASVAAIYVGLPQENSPIVLTNVIKFAGDTYHGVVKTTKTILDRLLLKTPTLDVIRAKLLAEEGKVSIRTDSRIAIGLGACTDLIVDSIRLLEKFPVPTNPRPHSTIESMQSFLELFAYYFKHGAASERYIKSKQVFNELIKLINDSKCEWRKHIGGNGPLMALRFANEGIRNILLGAQMSSEFVSQLPKSIRISGPIIERDDYHILLEYKANGRWGEYEAPRANRLIVHSDDNNVQLVSRTPFFQQTAQFKPDLLIISALQMMENSPVDFEIRTQSIEQLGQDLEIIRSESSKLRVHFELASYTEERLLGVIVDNVFPYVDSFGMNEQEAANLLSFLKYGNISYVTNSSPRIATVLDEMRELIALLNATGDGRITRVHVHTLPYQIVVVKLNSAGKPIWPNSSSAMAKASLTAYRHTCAKVDIELDSAKILLDNSFLTSEKMKTKHRIYFDEPVKCWMEDTRDGSRLQFCIAIGMVCTKVVQTGGAGDNVSAAGMVLQI